MRFTMHKELFYITFFIFQIAMKAQLLKPELLCLKGHSQIHCMQAIQNGLVVRKYQNLFYLNNCP